MRKCGEWGNIVYEGMWWVKECGEWNEGCEWKKNMVSEVMCYYVQLSVIKGKVILEEKEGTVDHLIFC